MAKHRCIAFLSTPIFLALALILCACSSSNSRSTGGAGGSATGGTGTATFGGAGAAGRANAGGAQPGGSSSETSGSSGENTSGSSGSAESGATDALSDDASAGEGGGSPLGADISGKITVPQGQSAVGVVVVACVPNTAGDCDPALSVEFQITASSGVFSFVGPDQPFYLFGWKDTDQDTTVNPGDLFGAALDPNNALLLLDAPVSGLTLSVALIPEPTGTVPAELVGTWSERYSQYTFNADGTFVFVFSEDFTGYCFSILQVKSASTGTVDVNGDQLTVVPKSGSDTRYDCFGSATVTPLSLAPQVYTYSIVLNAQSVPELHLVSNGTDIVYTKH